jgi:hypothetical protein
MAKINFLSGTVSNVSSVLCHAVAFGVEGNPVGFNLGLLNLSEGDEVKVAGFDNPVFIGEKGWQDMIRKNDHQI